MSLADDGVPFLQIVHISDLHLVDPNYPSRDEILRIDQVARRLPWLKDKWTDGTAPHDPLAPAEFETFLRAITVDDPDWRHRQVWLVDTGDLTTFGDDASLNMGRSLLNDWRKLAGAELLSLHGNHDAWPGKFPAAANGAEIDAHRRHLRTTHYPAHWVETPLRCPIPGTSEEVLLFGMNSVLHEKHRNTLARGEIKEDRYWEHAHRPTDGRQIARLRAHVGGSRAFRIVAVHHPVHYPNRPSFGMHMDNDADVARELGRATSQGSAPLAHLVLGGHTHKLFPEHEHLPGQVRLCHHPDLGVDQFQLVVGTLMQHDLLGERGKWPHQFQVLRFYAPEKHRHVLAIERLFVARIGGTGPYRFVPKADGKVPEEIVAAY